MSKSRSFTRGIRWLVTFVLLMGTISYQFPAEASEADSHGYHPVPVSGTWEYDMNGKFAYPVGIASDGSGNVYVADTNNNRIQKFDSSGIFVNAWGSYGNGDGQFIEPAGVAVDGNGNVYVADRGNRRIQKFDSNGAFVTAWGSLGSGDGQFSAPAGVAVDASGNVYVADTNNHRIQKFNSSGAFVTVWGSHGSGIGKFSGPQGVAVDGSGNIYVADWGNSRIQKIDSEGAFALVGGTGSSIGKFSGPQGVAVDGSGNVYVADTNNNRIQKFDSSGTFVTAWGSNGGGDGQFKFPRGAAVDGSGNVYVADSNNNRIQKFDASGNFLGKWGGFGSPSMDISYVAADRSGNVYVADTNNNRIQKFDSNGRFVTAWGSYGGGNGQFSIPVGVAVDGSGNVYVADAENNRIQKFDSSGTFITAWGSTGGGNGQFNWPTGVAVDGSGNVYVADLENNRIQKFDSSGTFVTAWGSWGSDDGQFNGPIGVAVDGIGNVYVADTRIQKFDSSGTFVTAWGTNGSGNGQFGGGRPGGVAVDGYGNVYVADTGNSRIQQFDSDGQFLTLWAAEYPETIAVDGTGIVYVSQESKVTKYMPDNVADADGIMLSAGGLSPAFDRNTVSFTVSVAANVKSVTITPTPADPLSTVSVSDASGTVTGVVYGGVTSYTTNLRVGENPVSIAITSFDESMTKTYTIIVNRLSSTDAVLGATAGDGFVDLAWTSVTEAVYYNVKRGTTDGGPYETIASSASATYTDTSVINGMTYYYIITAADETGEIGRSNQASATPLSVPTAPAGLAATPGDHQVALTWDAVGTAEFYSVKRSASSGGPHMRIATNLSSAAYTDTGLSNGTVYYYVVTAHNSIGESSNSAQVGATPVSSGGSGPAPSAGPVPNGDGLLQMNVTPEQGGTGELKGVVRLKVQAGAVPADGNISAAVVSPDQAPPTGSLKAASPVVEFTSSTGRTFGKPVEMTFFYDKDKAGRQVAIYYYNEQQERWIYIGGKVNVDGTVTVSVNHFTKFAVFEVEPASFADLAGHWATAYTDRLVGMKVIQGYPDRTFRPDAAVTRAQFAKMLAEALGLTAPANVSDFADDSEIPAWAKSAVSAAVKAGLISGYPEQGVIRFKADQTITRAEMAVMIARALNVDANIEVNRANRFKDAAAIPDWARASIEAAVAAGILTGYEDGTFRPDHQATRSEAAAMIYKLLEVLKL
ncbi:S-layer homology domain-containing protein [Paenibacillus sp. LHD-117]|uniref:S-layer homology domain-containing protein n=1 Tax=Paenibacillus sp. LHD-117 TaxID=3071412 RepID=UPI0027E026F1|nr:S-layer homology domain-containing protein [Paenibacillus sp. LHD-117]MDQ6422854.1 S-layer homology domain-containing protein [Paenibacillus sp. LHD-117]